MDNALFGLPFATWGILCLTVAVIYYLVWPKPKPDTPPRPAWMHLILRWAHALVWLLLAGLCFLMSSGVLDLAQVLGYLAFLLYFVFMATLVIDRRRSTKTGAK